MENIKTPYKSVLTIAGSDSGGCAGIQADIKSISACGVFAASVITASTAQNTKGVFDIHPMPILHIEKQLDAVFSDINFDAIKIGMLHSCEVIELVGMKLAEYNAKSLLKLTGLKTFKKDNIKDILNLGYDVEFLPAFTYQQ